MNQLYNPDWIEKGIKNIDAVTYKLKPALTRVTNHKLEVASKKKQKREEIVKRRKTKVMAIERWRTKRGISLFSEEEENYESDIGDETDSD